MSYDHFLDVEYERHYQDDDAVCGCGDMLCCDECRTEVTIVFEAFRSTKRIARKDHKDGKVLKGQTYLDHYSRVVWIDDDGDRQSDIYIKKTPLGEKK